MLYREIIAVCPEIRRKYTLWVERRGLDFNPLKTKRRLFI